LLERVASLFSFVAPGYATLQNARLILSVLEAAAAIQITDGIVTLTHRGSQMRLALAKGNPPRGLTAAFVRRCGDFTLTVGDPI